MRETRERQQLLDYMVTFFLVDFELRLNDSLQREWPEAQDPVEEVIDTPEGRIWQWTFEKTPSQKYPIYIRFHKHFIATEVVLQDGIRDYHEMPKGTYSMKDIAESLEKWCC